MKLHSTKPKSTRAAPLPHYGEIRFQPPSSAREPSLHPRWSAYEPHGAEEAPEPQERPEAPREVEAPSRSPLRQRKVAPCSDESFEVIVGDEILVGGRT